LAQQKAAGEVTDGNIVERNHRVQIPQSPVDLGVFSKEGGDGKNIINNAGRQPASCLHGWCIVLR
jgi:hypothetical protein